MKPIEPGCLAVVVSARLVSNIGKIVTVGRCLGRNAKWFGGPVVWEISPPLVVRIVNLVQEDTGKRILIAEYPEMALMRIDGFEEPEETEALEAIGVEHG